MSDDESPPEVVPPPELSTLGTQVLTRIVRELASPECVLNCMFTEGCTYSTSLPNKVVFADDVYAEQGRNFLVARKKIDKHQFREIINELIEKAYILRKDTLDGLTVTLNPACAALEDIRQKIYKDHVLY
tara:strand:+ start:128 stop:517 length:390 start_codon:yes stop_codon:yes gene_type:complete